MKRAALSMAGVEGARPAISSALSTLMTRSTLAASMAGCRRPHPTRDRVATAKTNPHRSHGSLRSREVSSLVKGFLMSAPLSDTDGTGRLHPKPGRPNRRFDTMVQRCLVVCTPG